MMSGVTTIAGRPVSEGHRTHEVRNQPPPLQDYDAYAADLPLQEAVRREGGAPPPRGAHPPPPPLQDYDASAADLPLQEAVRREGAGWAEERPHALGRIGGSAEAIAWGFEANENPPVLHTHDRYGHRID